MHRKSRPGRLKKYALQRVSPHQERPQPDVITSLRHRYHHSRSLHGAENQKRIKINQKRLGQTNSGHLSNRTCQIVPQEKEMIIF